MSENSFGPRLSRDGATFRLWAPHAKQVGVVTGRIHPMQKSSNGWFTADIAGLKAGTRYRFRIDDETDVPDPASAFQPDDVAGFSELIDHAAYRWRARDWRGRPWQETVLSEAHVGTFTPQGSFTAMIDKLDHLAATGITALELMPLADFPGERNWGYDGVLWYAPDSAYGRPEDLKALIDEAHLRGLMVFLDVVYNHFGPEGNYLYRYAKDFFAAVHTPWGNAINYRIPEARAFAIENALHWLRDYRFDGLRLDAVHAIPEQGEIPMLNELSRRVGLLAAETGRHIHLVLENDDNVATLLDPVADPAGGRYRAQWNDDYHHAWHVFLTGEDKGYYSDYGPSPLRHLARTLGSGFAYQGESSPHRDGAVRGEPSGALPTTAFVNFLQNHDQIGNRPLGERLETLAPVKVIEAALAITLLSPTVPMLFMGEEWGSRAPFPFFCDFVGDLADAIRKGRRKEFAGAYAEYGDDVPDPLDAETAKSAVLDWDAAATAEGRDRLSLVKRLLAIRTSDIVPRLASARFGGATADDDGRLRAHWHLADDATLRLLANLSDHPRPRGEDLAGTNLWGGDLPSMMPPWAVYWRLEET